MNPFSAKTVGSAHAGKDWRVSIEERGRTGSVVYTEPAGSAVFSWEFGGGGDTVAILYFEEDEAVWRERYPWVAARRQMVLERVAAEVIRQKCPSCYPEIAAQAGWINIRQGAGSLPVSTNPPWFRDQKVLLSMLVAALLLVGAALAVEW